MSTQGRSSDHPQQTPQPEAQTSPPGASGSTNLLHRWVRLLQQSGLWGNDAGQLRLEALATGPNTPPIQTLEEVRAARTAAVAAEEATESSDGAPWWEDAVCEDAGSDDEVCEQEGATPPVEESPTCDLDGEPGGRSEDAAELSRAEMPPVFTLPPLVTRPAPSPTVPPALPAAGEGLLSRIFSFGARWLGPVVLGMWPKETASPELTDRRYTGPEGGVRPEAEELPKDDNRCDVEAVKHLGGDGIHDACADSLPGNLIPGKDLLVTTPEGVDKNFDAYTPADHSVWEVKTHKLDDKSARSFKFLAGKQIGELMNEQEIARRCGYNFKISVSDLRQYELLRDLFDVVYRPECLHQEPEAPPEQGP